MGRDYKRGDDDAQRAEENHDNQRPDNTTEGCVVFHLLAPPEHQHEDQEDDRQGGYRDAYLSCLG